MWVVISAILHDHAQLLASPPGGTRVEPPHEAGTVAWEVMEGILEMVEAPPPYMMGLFFDTPMEVGVLAGFTASQHLPALSHPALTGLMLVPRHLWAVSRRNP